MAQQVPGWYPDPNDARQLRFWDGQKWTPNTKFESSAQVTTQIPAYGPHRRRQPAQSRPDGQRRPGGHGLRLPDNVLAWFSVLSAAGCIVLSLAARLPWLGVLPLAIAVGSVLLGESRSRLAIGSTLVAILLAVLLGR